MLAALQVSSPIYSIQPYVRPLHDFFRGGRSGDALLKVLLRFCTYSSCYALNEATYSTKVRY